MNRIFVNEFRLLSIVVSIYWIGGEFAVLPLVMQRGNSKQQQKTVVVWEVWESNIFQWV